MHRGGRGVNSLTVTEPSEDRPGGGGPGAHVRALACASSAKSSTGASEKEDALAEVRVSRERTNAAGPARAHATNAARALGRFIVGGLWEAEDR